MPSAALDKQAEVANPHASASLNGSRLPGDRGWRSACYDRPFLPGEVAELMRALPASRGVAIAGAWSWSIPEYCR
jgi:hypothetical protein